MNPVEQILKGMLPEIAGIQLNLMTAIVAVLFILLIAVAAGVISGFLFSAAGQSFTPDEEKAYQAYAARRSTSERFRFRYEREHKKFR